MKTVLLTGATGFIGSATLNALLAGGYRVYALYCKKNPVFSHPHLTWHQVDLHQKNVISQLLASLKPDYLIHLAWMVDHQIFWHAKSNIDYISATTHLYQQFSLAGGKKALFLGTSAEYDPSATLCDELETSLNPATLYGLCKKQTFELIKQLKRESPELAPFCWVRIFNIYGPNEHPDRLLPYLFLNYLRGERPNLAQPFAIRDYIHVENVAASLLALLNSTLSENVFNVGSGQSMSIMDLAEHIRLSFFKEREKALIPKEAPKANTFLPKLNRFNALNVSLPFTFEEGLKEAYTWWQQQVKAC